MKLPRPTFHAIHAAIYLAQRRPGTFTSSAKIAKALGHPPVYLRALLSGMTRAES